MEESWKKINAMIDELMKMAEKDLDSAVCDKLMEMREIFKDDIKDPLATKICRLAAEHIQANGSFDIDIDAGDEEEVAIDEPPFQYFLEILRDPSNKYNREELTAYKHRINEVRQY